VNKEMSSTLKNTAEMSGYLTIIIGILIIMIAGIMTYTPEGTDPVYLLVVYVGGGIFIAGIVLVRVSTMKKEPAVPELDEKDDDEYVF